ncbi:MAG: universal stress protein [Solirubrobacteraceae bacterium]
MILIAYDGSPDANEAIKHAGELMRGRPAAVVTVWEHFEDTVTRVGAAMPIGAMDYAEVAAARAAHRE